MQTYRQFLAESTRHVQNEPFLEIDNITIPTGSTYYTDDDGHLDREGGPAVEVPDGTKLWLRHGKYHREDGPALEMYWGSKNWYLYGRFVGAIQSKGHGTSEFGSPLNDREKWLLLKASPDRNLQILNGFRLNRQMQEWICQNRPDLITKVAYLYDDLREKYKAEIELGGVDL